MEILKELDKAAEKYALQTERLRQTRDEEFSDTSYYYEAFVKGAEFGIKEFKKSLWHEAQEMPEQDKAFIFTQECNNSINYRIGTMLRPEDYVKNVEFWHMMKWCYIEDILAKEGGEQ